MSPPDWAGRGDGHWPIEANRYQVGHVFFKDNVPRSWYYNVDIVVASNVGKETTVLILLVLWKGGHVGQRPKLAYFHAHLITFCHGFD
jgi:hypothetical protein